ncbi:hypothetical protein ONZ51_g580 [Trametes cubensis]|uniref:Dynamin N-terminal domain-containing protein n=1 Tax=Trametes cubensis TaxID=1111947 RepID=A0AAD7U570_9APHY|nr:hypothetical protein ONZ51_g580 [Trametes cubensis]
MPTPAPAGLRPIHYNADNARCCALELTDALEERVKALLPEDSLRKESFDESIADLRNKADTPKTMIVFCGATGAGKSSLINALLGQDIVPTSCMKACTSLITQIAYNVRNEYEAEVEFMSKDDWAAEARLLLEDVRDTTGEDVAEEVESARHKVMAVYPTLRREDLSSMTVDQVIAHESEVSVLLGNKVTIIKKDISDFSLDLARYIESQDGLINGPVDRMNSVAPAYWPLIRQIRILTNSPLLKCGAVLVDLPGLGGSNPARNRVTQGFVSKADRFFLVAPITRAVDDKMARDLRDEVFKSQLQMNGKYVPVDFAFDPHQLRWLLTDITETRLPSSATTKCDEISCKEVIKSLKLLRDPRLIQIESDLEASKHDLSFHQDRKLTLEGLKTDLEGRLTSLLSDHTPQAQPPSLQFEQQHESEPGVRTKVVSDERPPSPARNQTVVDDVHDTLKRNREAQSDADDPRATKLQKLSDSDEAVVPASPSGTQLYQAGSASEVHSQWSKAKLRAQFRAEMNENNDADPQPDATVDNGGTSIGEEFCDASFRHADLDVSKCIAGTTDLQVFTVAARPFMEIQEQAGSSPMQSPFRASDTEIPKLHEWVEMVTLAAREEAAAKMLIRLKGFARTVRGWVEGTPGVTSKDRKRLQAQWRSQLSDHVIEEHSEGNESDAESAEDDEERAENDETGDDEDDEDTREQEQPDLPQAQLKRYSIVQTSQSVTVLRILEKDALRRNGVFKHDLNAALALPLTKRIARAWTNVFKTKSLKRLKSKIAPEIKTVLDAVVASTPKYLRPRAEQLAVETLQAARRRLQDVQESIQVALENKQREVSGALSPTIQRRLMEGYKEACNVEKGEGYFTRQQTIFNDYLESKKATLFIDTAHIVERYLEEAAEAARVALYKALEKIAKEVEVEISILWEDCPVRDDDDVKAGLLSEITEEVDRWLAAKDASDKTARRPQL